MNFRGVIFLQFSYTNKVLSEVLSCVLIDSQKENQHCSPNSVFAVAVGLPDGRQVQEAVPDAEGAGDRVVYARVEEARQRRQDPAEVLRGDCEVKDCQLRTCITVS